MLEGLWKGQNSSKFPRRIKVRETLASPLLILIINSCGLDGLGFSLFVNLSPPAGPPEAWGILITGGYFGIVQIMEERPGGRYLWWLRQWNGSGGGEIFSDVTTLGVLRLSTILLWHRTTLCLVLRSAERYVKCLNMPSLETCAIYCQLGNQIPLERLHMLWFWPQAME